MPDRARQLAPALDMLKYTLSHRGEHVSENMSKAVRALVNLRDQLIDDKRSGHGDPSLPGLLDHTNSLISLAASLEYPLAGFHWKRIEEIRDHLQKMLASASLSS
jgi:hypothetical protein